MVHGVARFYAGFPIVEDLADEDVVLDVDDVSGEDLLEVMMVESIDKRVDGRVGITNPEDIEIELRGSWEFLKKDKHKIQMVIGKIISKKCEGSGFALIVW